MRQIRRLLIANRGEIACRIIRTCQKLGIETVAVYSDADCNAQHCKLANFSARLGPAAASASYLNEAKIIEIAKAFEVDAIHPGYGFLSEQASFATAVANAGIEFMGPSANALQLLGDKLSAKLLAEKVKVPTIPGMQVNDISSAAFLADARAIGFPLVLKAANGGGGRGLRIVEHEEDLAEAASRVAAEALAFFGAGELLIEKFVSPAYHIEVQVIGDSAGNVRHLFERDCSLQRRSQKVIEESPAAFVKQSVLNKLYKAAEQIGTAAGIQSLITVEFLVSKGNPEEFYFLEANPRIQVEHPVTEAVLGLDLVGLQLSIAQGETLANILPKKLKPTGHAIEARLYAECPERGFQPSTGSLVALEQSSLLATQPGERIDHGLSNSDRITAYYDPMIAKLIAHGPDRKAAQATLLAMLRRVAIFGVYTNNNFLRSLLEQATEEFVHTKAIDAFLGVSGNSRDEAALAHIAATAAFLARPLLEQTQLPRSTQLEQINYPIKITTTAGQVIEADFCLAQFDVSSAETTFNNATKRMATETDKEDFTFTIGKLSITVQLCPPAWGEQFSSEVLVDGLRYKIESNFRKANTVAGKVEKLLRAPLPGKIVKVLVAANDTVGEDQPLVVLESMKIEHSLLAPGRATVKSVHCKHGDAVNEGEVLIELK
jgi:acetyl/propionyl-CoA carboxylase alpha subunit